MIEVSFCRRCRAEISKEREQEAIKANWIPLCEKCDPELRKKFEKWYKKFLEMKF